MATMIKCELLNEEAAAVAAAVALVLHASKQDSTANKDYTRALADAMASMKEQFHDQHFDVSRFCRERSQSIAQ